MWPISSIWPVSGQRQHMYLWRAVDHEGEVLEILVQRRRDRSAAVKLMRKLLRKQGFAPTRVTTDKLRSYGAAFRHLGLSCHREQGLRENNRAENSHQVGRLKVLWTAAEPITEPTVVILCSESRRGTDEDGGIDPGDLSWREETCHLSLAWGSVQNRKNGC